MERKQQYMEIKQQYMERKQQCMGRKQQYMERESINTWEKVTIHKQKYRSHIKILKRFEPATFTAAVCYANHSATVLDITRSQNLQNNQIKKNRRRIKPKFYKCSFWAGQKAENNVYTTPLAQWKQHGIKIRRTQVQIYSTLYFKSGGCWFETRIQ